VARAVVTWLREGETCKRYVDDVCHSIKTIELPPDQVEYVKIDPHDPYEGEIITEGSKGAAWVHGVVEDGVLVTDSKDATTT
jgi:hypothetical protein